MDAIPRPVMWYAAPDYVRLTLNPDGLREVGLQQYQAVGMQVGRRGSESFDEAEAWSWMGYYGQKVGAACWGHGPQGAILQVSGSSAEEVVQHRPNYTGVPRLDVQVTIWLEGDVPHLARWCADRSHTYKSGRGGRGWRVTFIDGYGRGDTAYLGSRTSDVYLRVYDKWRETGNDEYRNAWRFEVELKRSAALAAWSLEHESVPSPEYWAGYVVRAFRDRGVSLPLDVQTMSTRVPVLEDELSRNERTLSWLRNQVSPSVERLIARGVDVQTVIEALALDRRVARR